MLFENVYEQYKIYAKSRHKKQGFITITNDFSNQILPYFIGKDIFLLTKQDIMNWQTKILGKNFSNKYNAKLYSTFKSFIKYCINCSYLKENIVELIGPFPKKIENKSYVTYNLIEFFKFRKNMEDFILKQFFTFMYFFGSRPGETIALRFSDKKRRYIKIRYNMPTKGERKLDTPKNKSSIRIIKISYLMNFRIWLLKKHYIKKYKDSNYDYFIFGGKKPLATTTIDRKKKKAYLKANLRPIKQHEFRHSYATRKIHKKTPIDEVSRSMGHSKVSTTLDIYVHNEKSTLNALFQDF